MPVADPHPRPSRWYRLAVAAAAVGGSVGARFNAKLARGIEGRRGLGARYADWARRGGGRDPRRPLVWFHAPSVGEGLQVKPVLEALRAQVPEWQLLYSFFSPSAERLARSLPVDFADYLPFDRPQAVAACLTAVTPSALVFGKLDVWPELALAAARRGVRLGMISATVSPHSSRLTWPALGWARPAYAALDRIGAISETDARRLERLGARPGAIRVTGDTRYDSVLDRAGRLDRWKHPFAALEHRSHDAFTIVAGSTWPSDERVVLAAFADLVGRAPGRVRLIVAPHEPTTDHLSAVIEAARRLELPAPVLLSQIDQAPAPAPAQGGIVLVDQIGLLADLYALGDVAFVGGGYHRAGLHSVLEPAAFGVPMCFGPRWEMSRDACLMIDCGAAVALPERGQQALVGQWKEWQAHAAARRHAGQAAASIVKEGSGATLRTVAMLRELVA